ncbi:hypothetical protein QYE76_055693 [Lolium multiflorum]|uniref:Uncharacterized protein n=1 Tax=Lolium multiflorum TaxID=4521 RepID=A0AAD8T0S0_LOLMU|nr:hypothetical protein QYE76_055693 [Lolium multiflorum]
MAESSNANAMVSGLKPGNLVSDRYLPTLSHHLTESRADLPDVLTSQRCYTFFDALAIPIPHNLSFTSSIDGFETWWSMWKTHAVRRALGPLLKQLDAEYDIPAEQQQDGPDPVDDDGSPFRFLPPAPVVLFYKNSPFLKKVVMQSQPMTPTSASQSRVSSRSAAPRASAKARTSVRKVAARKTLKRQSPAPAQESLHTSTEENSSEDTQSSRRDSSLGNSGKTTTQSQPDLPPSASKKRVMTSLLTFDPESIEPATAKTGEEPGPSTTHGQLQHLKALLSSSIETLVEDSEAVKSVLEDIQPHLPVTLQVKLWQCTSFARSRVTSARQRINLRHTQLPLKADIADKCQRLNEKKATLDAKTDTSDSTAELATMRKELEALEEKVWATKQLIETKEALIAHSLTR